MLNTLRHLDFFNPMSIKDEVHIIGVGAVGSHIASALARLGVRKIHIWDFDNVESHNIPNQMFTEEDLGKLKIDAVEHQLVKINPEISIIKHEKYKDQPLQGFIFSCVDNIEVRKEIYEANEFNVLIKAVFDTRIGLDAGQVFSADWAKEEDIDNLIAVSEFKHNEVEQVKSACGTQLTVLPTVQMTATFAVSNFINFIKAKTLKRNIVFNAFDFTAKSY